MNAEPARVSEPGASRRIWGLSLRARLVVALISALIVGAKFYLRMPIHVPGHSGVIWMALLVVGVGLIGRPGAGTLIGLLSGVLATIIVPGREGVFLGIKYFLPGLTVDLLTPLLGGRLDRYLPAAVIGAAAHMTKLASSYLIGIAMGVSGGYLAIGLGGAAVTHLVFGALGGLVGAAVLSKLLSAGIGEPEALAPTRESRRP